MTTRRTIPDDRHLHPPSRPATARRLALGGLSAAAAVVLVLATALPADAQASRSRPDTARSGGTATRTSPPPSPSSSPPPSSSPATSPSAGSGAAARTRPDDAGSGGRTAVSEDRRGSRGSRRVFHGGYYPLGFGWWGHYSPWWFGYGGYGPVYGPGGYGARWYGERVRDDMGALDLDLKPGDTKIYLDGQYIGTADRFDGWPGYLWLEEGSYQLVFYREGHETLAREYRIHPGLVIDVEDRLPRGEATPPEEMFAPRPTPRRDARVRRNEERRREVEAERSPADWRERSRAERERAGSERYAGPEAGAPFGSLRLTVEPADASVYLDGRFIGTGEELARLRGGLTLAAGRHTLSVVRPGHAPEETELEIEAGEVFELDVELGTAGTSSGSV